MAESTLEVGVVPTPIGAFRILYQGRRVRAIDLLERGVDHEDAPRNARRVFRFPAGSPPAQLREYFAGRRSEFDVEFDPAGGEFDQTVWHALREVRPGEFLSYGGLARRSGHPGSARAVGGAVGRNPIPIMIPCHRIVGVAGDLTGYGLGLWRKRWLLQHEGAWPLKSRTVDGPTGHGQRTLEAEAADPGSMPQPE